MSDEFHAAAYRDYEAAVKTARALWPGAAEGTLREAAADVMVHVRELRRVAGASHDNASPSSGVSSSGPAQAPGGPYAPTEKQVAFYRRLIASSAFSEEERRRALEWLATKATKRTIKDQIDWLKRQVESRRSTTNGNGGSYGH